MDMSVHEEAVASDTLEVIEVEARNCRQRLRGSTSLLGNPWGLTPLGDFFVAQQAQHNAVKMYAQSDRSVREVRLHFLLSRWLTLS